MTMSPSLRTAVVITALGAATLAGCSSGDSSNGSSAGRGNAVASLPSSEQPRDTTTTQDASSAAPRPRSKLFETEQETEANLVPYDNCMRAHGVPVRAGKPRSTEGVTPNVYKKADAACADKQPLPPIEMDASNPRALTFNRAVAACIRSHGATKVSVVTENGVISVSFGDSDSITIGLRYSDSCQRSVAAKSH